MTRRTPLRSILTAVAVLVAGSATAVSLDVAAPGLAQALDNTPWVLPSAPPRCTQQQANSGNVAGCIVAFYDDPSSTGWGSPPAPGVGAGWTWNGYWYNGSTALASWEASYIASNSQPVAGLRTGYLRTHVSVRSLFEGFLDEIAANGYRVRDAAGYAFRCTAGNGGWSCPSGDPDDLSNHAWGLAVDMNASTNPIRSYSSINGATACMTPVQTDLPQWVIQTAEKWGLYWGGYGWNSGCPSTTTQRTVVERDPPHFEFRGTPEQAAAIAGYNLRNDPNAVCRTIVDSTGQDVERCSRSTRPDPGWRLPVQLDPPAGAVAAMVNLTATDATAAGYLTIEDCAARTGERSVSTLNYGPGNSVASMAIVPIPSGGRICVYQSSAVHSVVDVLAYIGSQGEKLGFVPETPVRLTDTRVNGVCAPGQGCVPGPIPAGGTHVVPVANGDARIVNLTMVDSPAQGWSQVGRCSDVGPAGTFSNLNVLNNQARANLALVPPSTSGTCAFSLTQSNLIVDELGVLSASAGLGWKMTAQRRSIDTRLTGTKPTAGQIVHVPVSTTSPGVAVAVTITEAAAAGFVTVGTCADLANGAAGRTSNVNYVRGANATGLALVAVADSEICVYTSVAAHLVVDVQAELIADRTIGLLPITPDRAADSRTV